MRFKPASSVVLTIYVLFAGVIAFAQAAAPNASLTAETINPGADSSAQHLTIAQKQQVDDLLREQSALQTDPEALSRPIVKIISDAMGNAIRPPLQVDLAVPDAGGQFSRTIIKTADPDRYGITVGDYLI